MVHTATVTLSNSAAGTVGDSLSGYVGPTSAGVHMGTAIVAVSESVAFLDFACSTTSTAAGVTVVVTSGPPTGTLASCSSGDHSVTAMSVPGETTKETAIRSTAGADLCGSYATPNTMGNLMTDDSYSSEDGIVTTKGV